MNIATTQSGLDPEPQLQYRNNFARHILSLTLFIQSEVMNKLTVRHGHSKLRLNFEPYIALTGGGGARLSDIADTLGISRQAANQVANQIEAAGYLQRTPDPSDGRAKLLTRTPRAEAMVAQGARESARLQRQFAALSGAQELEAASLTLARLSKKLGLQYPVRENAPIVLAGILPRLSDYINSRLQDLTVARGHDSLKRRFGPVLMSIGPTGGRIQQIANAQDVSKQAISAIVSELEDLNYLERRPDPQDARQVILLFTANGRKLISDSVQSIQDLYREFCELVEPEKMAATVDTLARTYQSLQLEGDIFGHADTDDIGVLARQLTRQLGQEGARALAKLILSDNSEQL